jgi:hypothetical protein
MYRKTAIMCASFVIVPVYGMLSFDKTNSEKSSMMKDWFF